MYELFLILRKIINVMMGLRLLPSESFLFFLFFFLLHIIIMVFNFILISLYHLSIDFYFFWLLLDLYLLVLFINKYNGYYRTHIVGTM
jgi:hypothetical protein